MDSIVGGVIPNKYIPAVDKGIQEAAERGFVAGYPMVDFQAECYDGSYHDVDSNEMSFKMAGIQAFRNVASKCRPVLLEPRIPRSRKRYAPTSANRTTRPSKRSRRAEGRLGT